MTEKKLRGSVVNGYLSYIEKTWGKDGLDECKRALRIENLDIKDGGIYPNELMKSVLLWISTTHGMERIQQAGNYTVKNLGLLAYLVRFSSMEKMLERAMDRFREVYLFGEVGVNYHERGATGWMKDVSEIPENCEGWQGAFKAMMELTHTKGTVRKTKCQLKGDERCEYELEWK